MGRPRISPRMEGDAARTPAGSGSKRSRRKQRRTSYQGSNALPEVMEEAAVVLPELTPPVPQPRHKTMNENRILWSEGFDRVFRNKALGVQRKVEPGVEQRLERIPV